MLGAGKAWRAAVPLSVLRHGAQGGLRAQGYGQKHEDEDEDPVLAQTGSGGLYLKRREIFSILFDEYFR